MSLRTIHIPVAFLVAAAILVGCTAEPAGPRPTLPHPSYAPVVVPGDRATPRPAKRSDRPRTATPKPAAMTDVEWRVAFCKVQDEVFALQFAVTRAVDVGETRNRTAFVASLKVLARRIDRAQRSLASVQPRYAKALVAVQRPMLRAYERGIDLAIGYLRSPTASEYRAFVVAGKQADQLWRRMAKVTQRLLNGPHRFYCRH